MTFEVGQRVTFRSLQWEVENSSAEGFLTLFGRDHENRGHRMKVALGLEPLERTEVPELAWTVGAPRWDPLQWRALHDAFRLTLSHRRGNLASVDWGRLILEPYQLVPLQRIEHLPFPRLLIADDTGLGKTAEAGLILFRLLQKRRADRILVLCRAQPEPERLHDEFKEKFGIDLTVINDGADYERIRREVPAHLNVFAALPRIAMSMYFAAPSKRGSHIADDLAHARWDVVIIDEAHHVADRGGSTKRLAELGRIVAERCEALLLLTATPHDGKAESFASLLRLLDPYLVIDPERLDPALVRPLVVRRLKARVVKADGSRFIRRKVQPLSVSPTRAENWLDMGLRGYCKQLRERARQLERAGERARAMGASFLESFLRRRLASSAHACRESIARRLKTLEDRTALTAESRPAAPVKRAMGEPEPVELAPGEPTPDRDPRPVEIPELDLPSGKSEVEVLRDLAARAARIPEGGETKIRKLVELVDRILADPAEKVLVFTEFTDTLDLLVRVFVKEGWAEIQPEAAGDEPGPGRAFFRYHGETRRTQRETIRKAFLGRPDVRMLLATDAASESINLHKGCNNLIHLETVWNPNRYEQRNGRIDRYGQTRRPEVFLLINSRSIDERVASVGYAKLERIAEALGSVSNVLPLVAALDVDQFLDRFGGGEEEGDEGGNGESAAEKQLAQAERAMEAQVEAATAGIELAAGEDGTGDLVRGESFEDHDLRAVEAALSASREFVPEYRDVEEFLRVFLRAEAGRMDPVPGETDVFAVTVPASLRADVGLERIARATFRRDLAVREAEAEEVRRVEFLSPGHPLVRTALRRARGWVYQNGFTSRVSYRRVRTDAAPGYVFTFAARFLDGRGEAIEESFDAVFVGLDGTASHDPLGDMRRFVDLGAGGNATESEEALLKGRFAAGFGKACGAADAEARRRAEARVRELAAEQKRIVEDALIRLGIWKHASEERLQRKLAAEIPKPAAHAQLDLLGEKAREIARVERERERKLKAFRAEQARLLVDEERRRADIRSMEEVRLDAVDLIGALALLPEARR